MSYCYGCGHTTGGKPLFCNYCGKSYDVKLCRKLHANPRTAEACSQCGSRDLSTPQPRIPLLWRILAIAAQVASAALLLALSLPLMLQILADLGERSQIPDTLLLDVFLLITLWSLWVVLPDGLRRVIRSALTRKSGFNDSGESP